MRYFILLFAFTCVAIVSILGFRGSTSRKPPIYIFPDMDDQAKYKPQGSNDFFEYGMNDQPIVPGTISRGNSHELAYIFSEEYSYAPAQNPSLYSGKNDEGKWFKGLPVSVDHSFMELGKKKYTIYCTPCHGTTGDGNGITKQYGMIATPSYHLDRLRDMPEGEIFNTITHGKGQMNSYADKLKPEERWAVIAYLRALQQAQNGRIDDVPQPYRSKLES